jgi:hypothetical protein
MVENRLKDDDLPPTLDSNEQLRRVRARREAMLKQEIRELYAPTVEATKVPEADEINEAIEEEMRKLRAKVEKIVKQATEEEQKTPIID